MLESDYLLKPSEGFPDVWLASISDFDASVHQGLTFAGSLLAELLNMETWRYRKRENQALGCRICRRRDRVAMQLSMLCKK